MVSPASRQSRASHLPKPLSSNEIHLLIYTKENFCLINRELTIVKQIPWNNGRVWDMCWSTTLNRFIIVAHYQICLVDPNTMDIQPIITILN